MGGQGSQAGSRTGKLCKVSGNLFQLQCVTNLKSISKIINFESFLIPYEEDILFEARSLESTTMSPQLNLSRFS